MEFIRKINKTEMVTVERMVPTYYEEEQTREVFVIELSRQDINILWDICASADFRRTNSRRNKAFADKLRKLLFE